jgi:hypothetical protein
LKTILHKIIFSMNRLLRVCGAILLVATTFSLKAQIKIGDNPGSIDPNAVLELESTTKGLLFPRMTDAQMTTMTAPTAGMVVYNTTNGCLYIRRASDWFSLCNADPTSTTNGFQLPRVTDAQMGAITNTTVGQLVYNTDQNCVFTRTGTGWVSLCNTASNGLTMVGTDVRLGGTLTGNTTIAAGANTLTITGNNPLNLPGLQTGTTNTIVTLGAGGNIESRNASDLLNTTAWRVDGNSGTNVTTNFLGTTDAQGLAVRTNNTERMRVLSTGEVAVGRTTANATFHLGGSMALPITNQSAAYAVSVTDYTVISNCTTAGFTLTLPDPTTCAGRTYILVKGDATNNVLTFSRPIFLSASQSMSSVNYNVRLHIQSDGTQWWLIARF